MILEDKEFLVNLAKFGGECKGMCKDCAFRQGSEANNDEKAVEAAHEAIFRNIPFHCHTPDFKPLDKICAGYASAMKYVSTLPKEEPFIYEYSQ